MCLTADLLESFGDADDDVETIETAYDILQIENTWDIFNLNGAAIQQDFELLTKGRKSAALSKTNRLIGENPIFIEEGAVVEFSILNTQKAPFILGGMLK